MSIKITWLGHSAFEVQVGETSILIDPFLTGNPVAPIKADSLNPEFILLTHGHGDHLGDTAEIAKRSHAKVIAPVEVAAWLAKHGVDNTSGQNLGGGHDYGFGRVELTPAWHSSSLPDGSYGGNPAGFLIFTPEITLYHAGDTALFSDMKLIGEKSVDVALLPIGDFFTMGPSDSIKAIQWIQPKYVLPIHYNTFPHIVQNVAAWAERVNQETKAQPIVLDPGGSYEF